MKGKIQRTQSPRITQLSRLPEEFIWERQIPDQATE